MPTYVCTGPAGSIVDITFSVSSHCFRVIWTQWSLPKHPRSRISSEAFQVVASLWSMVFPDSVHAMRARKSILSRAFKAGNRPSIIAQRSCL